MQKVRADALLGPHLHGLHFDHVVALGKAARVMAEKAVESGAVSSGLVICSDPELGSCPTLTYLRGDHPDPAEHSLASGIALANFADSCLPKERILVLLSGGASAMAELPIEGRTLAEVQREARRLMSSGADIAKLNEFRRSVSQLKAGGLARRMGNSALDVYVLSDVQGSDPAVIGSGPFWTGLKGAPHTIIGDASLARSFASHELAKRGLEVIELGWIGGNAAQEGARFADAAKKLRPHQALVASGEPTAIVRSTTGLGGRCQEFALAAASRLQGSTEMSILAAGTDGRDGPTDAAGAISTGQSWDDDSQADLDDSNSNRWAHRLGTRIPSWTTDTNVNDLFLAVRI